MNPGKKIGEAVISSVVGLIVVSAIISWAAEYDSGGPFSFPLDMAGRVATWILNPEILILIIAIGFVHQSLTGSDF